jgi:hypothetical protein
MKKQGATGVWPHNHDYDDRNCCSASLVGIGVPLLVTQVFRASLRPLLPVERTLEQYEEKEEVQ